MISFSSLSLSHPEDGKNAERRRRTEGTTKLDTMERRYGERRLISHFQLQCNRLYHSQSRLLLRQDLSGDGEHDEAGRRPPPSLQRLPQSLEDNCAHKIVETTLQYYPDVSEEEGVSENGGPLLKKTIVKKRVEQCKRP